MGSVVSRQNRLSFSGWPGPAGLPEDIAERAGLQIQADPDLPLAKRCLHVQINRNLESFTTPMRHLAILLFLPSLCLPAHAADRADLARKFKQLPTVPEAELPPLTNEKSPFRGVIQHDGLRGHTWAAFPHVENPASLGIDPKGRVFVAEANRFWLGVPDLRGANEMIRDDFQAITVDDRQKMYDKFAAHFPEGWFSAVPDRIIRLADKDDNGAADHRTLFSDAFKEPLDGIGFSVLAERDAVYFTCIPALRKLTDPNDDGVADSHEKLVEGFGVRVSFIGHDMHGVIRGPDGRLYFSIGDRGYHVTDQDGKVHQAKTSGRGAVFRCDDDGSNFEVYATGLRNPQELAFDDYGNLFTFDNTGDIGDKARIVYVLENSDSGWDMAHQSPHHYREILDWGEFHPAKSMWVAEKMFETHRDDQPQWVYPPLAHVANGPSGVTWLTGEAIPEDLRGQFLLTNYRGAAAGSNTLAIELEPEGAGFRLKNHRELIKGVAAADVELGYDGKLYFADYGGGWSVNTNGSIQVLEAKDAKLRKAGAEVAELMEAGFSDTDFLDLRLDRICHRDYRVRQAAQFELVNRGAAGDLRYVVTHMLNLHAIWGLGQLARQGEDISWLMFMLESDEAEIRANVARVMGDVRLKAARGPLLERLADESARVRSLAAIALGRVCERGDEEAVSALFQAAAENSSDKFDPVLRHSYLSALDRIATDEMAAAKAKSQSREERLLAVLVLRRHESELLGAFLSDIDPQIRLETIRAIYDTSVLDTSVGERIAALSATGLPETVQRRIVAANYRKGTAEHAKRLVNLAADASLAMPTRLAALHGLRMWEGAIDTDPVLGHYRPQVVKPRTMQQLCTEITAELRAFLTTKHDAKLTALATKLADEAGVALDPATLREQAANLDLADEVRVATLDSLAQANDPADNALIAALLDDSSPAVQAGAIRHAFARKIPGIAERATIFVGFGPIPAARAAIDGLAAANPAQMAAFWDNREVSLRRELWLDAYLALKPTLTGELPATFVHSLSESGGDVARGELVFRNQGACLQCHMVQGSGGVQGPDLTVVGDRLKPAKIVESVVNPAAEIAEGYGMSSVALRSGTMLMGRLAKQTDDAIHLVALDGKHSKIVRADIATISPPVSAMPPLGATLPPRDLRDLIAFLAAQTKENQAKRDAESHGEEGEEIAK